MNQFKFQATAARAIDAHAQAIGHLAQELQQTNDTARVSREFVADLAARTEPLGRLATLTLMGRLRWLLTGR